MGLRDLVRADLQRAQRLIERIDDDLDPQFRIASPGGDWWIGMTLSEDPHARLKQLGLVSRFMAWKSCPAFTQAVELVEPEAIVCVGVSHEEVVGLISLMDRKRLRFSAPQGLAAAQIGDEIPALLPRGVVTLTERDIAELKDYFGAEGVFPAVHIPSGRIGVE
ncbi:MAG: hypothetical protein WC807_17245 [Hyphomicrobium sp.]|jgi:hypothetical protein